MTNEEAITILVKEVEGIPSDVWDEQSDKFADAVHLAIKVLKERPQGEWLHPYTTNIACECSNCHLQLPITDYFNFCPNCGADMREGNNDG